MKLENQVVSLELAKKLKELGVPQKSAFGWYHWDSPNKWEIREFWHCEEVPGCYSAFTVAELGEMLPSESELIKWGDGNWKVAFDDYSDDYDIPTQKEKNLADAMAKMLIYLLENKLIKL